MIDHVTQNILLKQRWSITKNWYMVALVTMSLFVIFGLLTGMDITPSLFGIALILPIGILIYHKKNLNLSGLVLFFVCNIILVYISIYFGSFKSNTIYFFPIIYTYSIYILPGNKKYLFLTTITILVDLTLIYITQDTYLNKFTFGEGELYKVILFTIVIVLGGIIYINYRFYSTLVLLVNQLELEKKEKEKLLTLLFHDLGRNISLLSGYIDINKKEPDDTSSKEKIYSLTEELKTILKTTSVLDLNRNDALVVEELRLFSLYTSLKLLFEKEFQNKALEFIFEGDRELSIKAVRSHLYHHILGNIISNAIKFSNKGSSISFKVAKTKNELSLKITNHGMKFEDSPTLGTDGESGNGQGLKIVKEFAQKNNFAFSIYSEKELTIATLKRSIN